MPTESTATPLPGASPKLYRCCKVWHRAFPDSPTKPTNPMQTHFMVFRRFLLANLTCFICLKDSVSWLSFGAKTLRIQTPWSTCRPANQTSLKMVTGSILDSQCDSSYICGSFGHVCVIWSILIQIPQSSMSFCCRLFVFLCHERNHPFSGWKTAKA